MPDNDFATTVSRAVELVLNEIRTDVVDGLYEEADGDALSSFGMLHDFVDANDYIQQAYDEFCPAPWRWSGQNDQSWYRFMEWNNAVTDGVDALLYQRPIPTA